MSWIIVRDQWKWKEDEDHNSFHSTDELASFYLSGMAWDRRTNKYRRIIDVELPEFDE